MPRVTQAAVITWEFVTIRVIMVDIEFVV